MVSLNVRDTTPGRVPRFNAAENTHLSKRELDRLNKREREKFETSEERRQTRERNRGRPDNNREREEARQEDRDRRRRDRRGEEQGGIQDPIVLNRGEERRSALDRLKEEFDRPIFEGTTFSEKAISAITSPKSTVILGTILAGLLTLGGSAGATGAGATTRGVSVVAQRQIIGNSGKVALKKLPIVAKRFPANTKTAGLTSRMLSKIFTSTRVVTSENIATGALQISRVTTPRSPLVLAVALTGIIGSYPFAGFLKEEALQTLSFGVSTAERNKDIDGMERALEDQADLLDPNAWRQILASVPFVNVLSSLQDFYKSALTKMEIDKKRLDDLKNEVDLPTTETFAESSNRFAEERRARELREREEDTAFFDEQRTSNREREVAEREEDRQFFDQIAQEQSIEQQQAREDDEAFFARIREENDRRAREGNEQARKNTLFFEAIRKRNAGIRLSEEEIAILRERGASTDTFGQGGRSTVQF